MIKKYTPFIHRIIARNKHLFKFTLMIRNQCYCIIQNHVSDGVDLRYNGEKLIIEEVAGLCNSFVDVGANIGEWSKEFLKSNPEISIGYLFEPNPQYFSKLKKEFSEERCKLFNFALSNKEYQTSFIIDGRSSRIDLI